MWVSHSVKLSLSVPLTVTLCSPVPGWVNRSTCTDTSPTGSSTPGSSKNVQELLIRNASKHDWFGLKPYGHLKFVSFFFCCCCCHCIGLFILLFFLQLLCSFIWSAFIFSHTIPYPSLLPCFVASFLPSFIYFHLRVADTTPAVHQWQDLPCEVWLFTNSLISESVVCVYRDNADLRDCKFAHLSKYVFFSPFPEAWK